MERMIMFSARRKSKKTDPKLLMTFSEYNTFQGFYKITPADGSLDPERVFNLCILYVTGWLRERVERNKNFDKTEVQFLYDYPDMKDPSADGFDVLEKQAAKATVSEKYIIEKANSATKKNDITCLEEICLVRGYNTSKIVSVYKTRDLLLALTEGGATGAFGFWGLPANLVLSTFYLLSCCTISCTDVWI